MPKYELLNNVQHIDLRVDTTKTAEYGDNVAGTVVFPEEFAWLHKEYPIYFQKSSETGEFQAIVPFGFQASENLFLTESGWGARYIPALMRREPFFIGFQSQRGQGERVPVVNIDMESPRVNPSSGGERVFLENGGNSPFLQEISRTLLLIHEGLNSTRSVFETFLQYDLIEPFTLDITFDNGEKYLTNIYYTINREKMYALDDATVGMLHRSGHLQLAYMVLDSLVNVKHLIDRKNAVSAESKVV